MATSILVANVEQEVAQSQDSAVVIIRCLGRRVGFTVCQPLLGLGLSSHGEEVFAMSKVFAKTKGFDG